MKLIHITDTHLVAPDRRLYGLDPRDRLAAAVADINTHHADAEGVIITGDLTDRGEPAAYQALREVLGELAMPCYLGMGNHDAREHLQSVFPELPQDEHGFVQYAQDFGACVLVMLDSAVAGEAAGLLCEARLEWLDLCLSRYPDRRILLALHHPPMALGIRYMGRHPSRQSRCPGCRDQVSWQCGASFVRACTPSGFRGMAGAVLLHFARRQSSGRAGSGI